MGSIPVVISYITYMGLTTPPPKKSSSVIWWLRFFMIVFTRKYPIQRILKKRFFKKNKLPKLHFGTIGLYCLYSFRFEYRYCLFFRKFFKRLVKRRKRKIRTCMRRRTWLFIRPNYTLTHKSKNARMGKGKGNFKRWCTIIYPGRIFIEHTNISQLVYTRFVKKMQIKMKIFFKIATLLPLQTKNSMLTATSTGQFKQIDIIRTRKTLFSRQALKI